MFINNIDILTRFSDDNITNEDLHIEEFLGLNPDGIRKRFPLAWSGIGRYEPNSLQIFDYDDNRYLTKNEEFTEEDNGLYFNFVTAPNKLYSKYKVEFTVRLEDYKFSKGLNDTTPGEEYFLFPNWKEAEGCGIGFWVGKYLSSRSDSTSTIQGVSDIPQSKKGIVTWRNPSYNSAKNAISNKGESFHLMTNREWSNIGFWIDHFKLNRRITGNMSAFYIKADYKNTDISGFLDVTNSNKSTLPGLGPDYWNHNLRNDGISDIIGNLWEIIDGIKINSFDDKEEKKSGIFVFDQNNKYPNTYTMQNSAYILADIIETIDFNIDNVYTSDNPINIEGLPTSLTTILYSASVKDKLPTNILKNSEYCMYEKPYCARRSGFTFENGETTMWYLWLHDPFDIGSWYDGFRICKNLI